MKINKIDRSKLKYILEEQLYNSVYKTEAYGNDITSVVH